MKIDLEKREMGKISTQKFKRMLSSMLSMTDENMQDGQAIKKAFEFTKGHCLFCAEKMYVSHLDDSMELIKDSSFDHLIPATYFGLFTGGNVALTCKNCNNEKADLSAIDYYEERFYDNKVCYFNTPKEFKAALDEFQAQYREAFPSLYKLNMELSSGRITEISMFDVLKAAEDTTEVIKPTIKFFNENKSRLDSISRKKKYYISERKAIINPESVKINKKDAQIQTLLDEVIESSLKTNQTKLGIERNKCEEFLEVLFTRNPRIMEELKDMSKSELTFIINKINHELKWNGKKMRFMYPIFTRLAFYFENPDLVLDLEYYNLYEEHGYKRHGWKLHE